MTAHPENTPPTAENAPAKIKPKTTQQRLTDLEATAAAPGYIPAAGEEDPGAAAEDLRSDVED